ncbi:metallophosphoesterase family protein [Levilactobacillus acidifarinae]|uniref:Metallophosphoesterase n=1 Tax=Levilactobacillus acidifarinae DSM 19394 = JCM 15949 TaxID=1423715 RepID=A0A0R1LJC5_9LACO|nr:metallophosphoesterase family protein [Levilactobacillus acidifarinae]KRK96014.1 metallophosphoesterase [Levilactobacillus acidifarinae DSM 19394]GEO69318.1 ser/threonine protein phosphatase [Levilactobacillus acidifarinae]
MHKIAVISDVHGNVTALRAVIADAKRAHCTDFWYLGDLFVPGPGAHDLLADLDALPITAYLRGNWEDGLLETIAGQIDAADPSDVYESFIDDYVNERLAAADVARIRRLPMVQTVTLDGLTFQLTHNLPDRNSGQTLSPEGDQTGFDQLARGGADIMVYGHVHHQLLRQSTAGQMIVNPGTVGMPFPHWGRFAQDLRAQYAIITTHGRRLPAVTFRQVPYDVTTEIALARDRQLPYADLYADQLTTGHVYTHDLPALTRVTQRPGEAERLRQLMAKYTN